VTMHIIKNNRCNGFTRTNAAFYEPGDMSCLGMFEQLGGVVMLNKTQRGTQEKTFKLGTSRMFQSAKNTDIRKQSFYSSINIAGNLSRT
jgi:hypothetical protein